MTLWSAATWCLMICMPCPPRVQAQRIWHPPVNTTWQWQIQYMINTSFSLDMYDVDLFDAKVTTFEDIKAMGAAVMCYFSAGTREEWRDDANDFPVVALGEPLGDWDGEVWIDINNQGVRDVISARLDLAARKGCDGVEPDNTQVYAEALWGRDTGLDVTAEQQLDYSIFLATEAHKRNLSIGLKNNLYQLAELEPYYDWAINESCFDYDECGGYADTFIAKGKAVFHASYDKSNLAFCAEANAMGMSAIVKAHDLGPARCSCQDPSTDYQCGLLLRDGEVPPPSSSYGFSTSTSLYPTEPPTVAPVAPPTEPSTVPPTVPPKIALTIAPTVSSTDMTDTGNTSGASARMEYVSPWVALAAGAATAAALGVLVV